MKVLELNTPFEIRAVVRVAPVQSDVLVFTARNESTGLTTDYILIWSVVNGRLIFTLPNTNPDFIAGNKYEIYITNNNLQSVIYRGKMIVVKENTNIQNYTPSIQLTQRYN
jgi:hypothetical protein